VQIGPQENDAREWSIQVWEQKLEGAAAEGSNRYGVIYLMVLLVDVFVQKTMMKQSVSKVEPEVLAGQKHQQVTEHRWDTW
jgi:hypothetical protein